MNPLFSLFILAIFIEDYIFREGKFWKMYLYAIGIYTLFYTFQHRSTFHSPTKKFNMAGYNQSFDPTIYAKVKFDLTKAREFMAKKEKEVKMCLRTITVYFQRIEVPSSYGSVLSVGKWETVRNMCFTLF